jgi:hypothetical protein
VFEIVSVLSRSSGVVHCMALYCCMVLYCCTTLVLGDVYVCDVVSTSQLQVKEDTSRTEDSSGMNGEHGTCLSFVGFTNPNTPFQIMCHHV